MATRPTTARSLPRPLQALRSKAPRAGDLSSIVPMEPFMADQRHFRLAYRELFHNTADRRRRRPGHARMRLLAERIRTAVSHLSNEYQDPLLDEEFDELSCEPERLVQLANQL